MIVRSVTELQNLNVEENSGFPRGLNHMTLSHLVITSCNSIVTNFHGQIRKHQTVSRSKVTKTKLQIIK